VPQGEGEIWAFFALLVFVAFLSVFLRHKCIRLVRDLCDLCLQCFDTVGWAAGMASGL